MSTVHAFLGRQILTFEVVLSSNESSVGFLVFGTKPFGSYIKSKLPILQNLDSLLTVINRFQILRIQLILRIKFW